MKAIFFVVLATIVSSATAATCNQAKITEWMQSCDKLSTVDDKCKNSACHKALHHLLEDDVRKCYVETKMGSATDLDKYSQLDETCHNEPFKATSNATKKPEAITAPNTTAAANTTNVTPASTAAAAKTSASSTVVSKLLASAVVAIVTALSM
ncbi:Aste57867_8448 [Aphanomyces stellatus]|uniref:Aste57867_8448 protein n=1 Tax=Aphanomyces stellatus TaxID=120398 RepID=A0A485KKA9_9STRA|nr:hypothetical protein As57867_008416 [Aphanomyces stellatus]VFT85334.1 Aste57867_8448 [Aphanomyces stellatus]